jgi:quercetin dioxygenase-like cupin family protein
LTTTPTSWIQRADDAETIENPSLWLLADGAHTGGALGANRLRLTTGAAGTQPHVHQLSSEAFYVLDGTLEMLIDDTVHLFGRGDYVVVAPGVSHAFGAAPGATADLFITIAPGIDRFPYFRLLSRVLAGELSDADIARIQTEYDVHFVENPAWTDRRGQ